MVFSNLILVKYQAYKYYKNTHAYFKLKYIIVHCSFYNLFFLDLRWFVTLLSFSLGFSIFLSIPVPTAASTGAEF